MSLLPGTRQAVQGGHRQGRRAAHGRTQHAPLRASISCFPTASVTKAVPFRTVSVMAFHALGDSLSVGEMKLPAALFITTCRGDTWSLQLGGKETGSPGRFCSEHCAVRDGTSPGGWTRGCCPGARGNLLGSYQSPESQLLLQVRVESTLRTDTRQACGPCGRAPHAFNLRALPARLTPLTVPEAPLLLCRRRSRPPSLTAGLA